MPILPKSKKPITESLNPEIRNANLRNDSSNEVDSTESVSSGSADKIIHAKPPIVVRDFALQLGLKPFKLISELMEMGIFASMNQTIEEPVAMDLARRHGFTLEVHHRGEAAVEKPVVVEKPKLDEDDPKFLKPRPPVCCMLGMLITVKPHYWMSSKD